MFGRFGKDAAKESLDGLTRKIESLDTPEPYLEGREDVAIAAVAKSAKPEIDAFAPVALQPTQELHWGLLAAGAPATRAPTAPRIPGNHSVDKESNMLSAVDWLHPQKPSPESLDPVFSTHTRGKKRCMCFPQMFNLRFIRSPAAKASGGPIIERVFDKQWMQRPEDVLERTTHVQRPETLTARQFLKRAGVKDRAAAQTGVENDQAHARAAATDPELDSPLSARVPAAPEARPQ